jgi:hypothetical protein
MFATASSRAVPSFPGPSVGPAADHHADRHADPLDEPLGRLGGVEVLRWPQDAERRAELAGRGEPCVLVLGIDAPVPPTGLGEDWVREPVDATELVVRCETVRRRVECATPPTLDDGLLLHHGAWAAIPPAQVAMVELLLERLGRVVTKRELAAAAAAAGGSDHEDAVKAAMARLGRRVAPLGLTLRSIRGRGHLLEVLGTCPVHATPSAAETKGSST